jgi:hypothetical protein
LLAPSSNYFPQQKQVPILVVSAAATGALGVTGAKVDDCEIETAVASLISQNSEFEGRFRFIGVSVNELLLLVAAVRISRAPPQQ